MSDGAGRPTAAVPRAVLIGPPGAGKSTIGRRLARALDVEVLDTDAAIEEDTGRTIPEIFAEDGEPTFRQIEERVVLAALAGHPGIVSLGGGAVLSPTTRAALTGHVVVYLEISIGEGLRRTGVHNASRRRGDDAHGDRAPSGRPLLAGDDAKAKYRELMRARRPLYRGVATIRIRTDGRSPARVVETILDRMGVPRPEAVPVTRRGASAAPPTGSSERPSAGAERSADPGRVPTPADAAATSRRGRTGHRRGRRSHRSRSAPVDAQPKPQPHTPTEAESRPRPHPTPPQLDRTQEKPS